MVPVFSDRSYPSHKGQQQPLWPANQSVQAPRALCELSSAFHIVHKWLCALFLDNYTLKYADDTILIY